VDRELDNGLTDQAAEIEVQQTIEGPTTFRVKFSIDICRGNFSLVDDARLNPGPSDPELTVLAYLNGENHVLAHGIITQRKLNLAEGGSGSSLEITGQDRRLVMNRVEEDHTYEGRASDIVKDILSSYKFETDVVDTEISYEENGTTLSQAAETDLTFVDKLAGRYDRRFWIDWKAGIGLTGFDLTETAHFKPSPPRPADNPLGFLPPLPLALPFGGANGPELKLNSGDGCSNVASFEVNSQAEAPNQSGPIARVDPDSGEVTDTEAPEPTTEGLGGTAATPPQARARRLVTAGNAQEARVRTQAALNDASWSVQATAETSVQSLNAIVSPHQIVKVTGAGELNSGDYFVKAVSHTIDPTGHKMRIELLRNALGGS
jgi:hypothetical protein